MKAALHPRDMQATPYLAFELFGIPASILVVLVVVVLGLLLIRTAITVVKIAILVGIAVAIFLFVQYVLKNFG